VSRPTGARAIFRIDDLLAKGAAISCATAVPGRRRSPTSGSETVLRFQVHLLRLRSHRRRRRDGDPVPDHRSRRLSRLDPGRQSTGCRLLNPACAGAVAPANIAAPTPSEPLTVGSAGGQTLSCDPNAAAWEGSPTFSISGIETATQSAAPAHPPTSPPPRPCHRGHLSVRGYRRQRRRQCGQVSASQNQPLPR